MARLQGPHLRGNAEQFADEILHMRGGIDQQIGFGFTVEAVGRGARRHQPVMQCDIARGEMRNEDPVQTNQSSAIVEVSN